MASFGLVPQGNLPQNPNGVGTLFRDGVRVGQKFTRPEQFTNSIGVSPSRVVQINPSRTRWGEGVLLGTTSIYNISPAPASTNGDICYLTDANTPGNQTLTAGGDQNQASSWAAICANGLPGLQLDWPRSVEFIISGNQTAPLTFKVFGYDWYGQPMQMSVDNIISVGGVDTAYSPVARTLDLGAETNNKAFYQITRVFMFGNVSATAEIKIQTCASFGLPFALNQTLGMPIQVYWDGAVDLNQPDSQVIWGDNRTPTDTTGDVRGTYVPASDPEPDHSNRLIIMYYVYGVDAAINEWSALGMPDWGNGEIESNYIVPPLDEQELYGLNQYYTGTPV